MTPFSWQAAYFSIMQVLLFVTAVVVLHGSWNGRWTATRDMARIVRHLFEKGLKKMHIITTKRKSNWLVQVESIATGNSEAPLILNQDINWHESLLDILCRWINYCTHLPINFQNDCIFWQTLRWAKTHAETKRDKICIQYSYEYIKTIVIYRM